jgi:hypothetical protein
MMGGIAGTIKAARGIVTEGRDPASRLGSAVLGDTRESRWSRARSAKPTRRLIDFASIHANDLLAEKRAVVKTLVLV